MAYDDKLRDFYDGLNHGCGSGVYGALGNSLRQAGQTPVTPPPQPEPKPVYVESPSAILARSGKQQFLDPEWQRKPSAQPRTNRSHRGKSVQRNGNPGFFVYILRGACALLLWLTVIATIVAFRI